MGKYWFGKRADETVPLGEADKNRPAPPANPTGIPGQKPLPADEVSKLAETSSKSLLDAGLNLEKAVVGLQKIASMATMTDADRGIAESAKKMAQGISDAKNAISALAEQVREFGGGLSKAPQTQSPSGPWMGK